MPCVAAVGNSPALWNLLPGRRQWQSFMMLVAGVRGIDHTAMASQVRCTCRTSLRYQDAGSPRCCGAWQPTASCTHFCTGAALHASTHACMQVRMYKHTSLFCWTLLHLVCVCGAVLRQSGVLWYCESVVLPPCNCCPSDIVSAFQTVLLHTGLVSWSACLRYWCRACIRLGLQAVIGKAVNFKAHFLGLYKAFKSLQ